MTTTKLQNVGLDVIVLIAITAAGWVYNAGTLSEQLRANEAKVTVLYQNQAQLEQKIDSLTQQEYDTERKLDRVLYSLGEGPPIKEIPQHKRK